MPQCLGATSSEECVGVPATEPHCLAIACSGHPTVSRDPRRAAPHGPETRRKRFIRSGVSCAHHKPSNTPCFLHAFAADENACARTINRDHYEHRRRRFQPKRRRQVLLDPRCRARRGRLDRHRQPRHQQLARGRARDGRQSSRSYPPARLRPQRARPGPQLQGQPRHRARSAALSWRVHDLATARGRRRSHPPRLPPHDDHHRQER